MNNDKQVVEEKLMYKIIEDVDGQLMFDFDREEKK